MGMYTEIIIKTTVKDDLPPEVSNVLNYLFNDQDLLVDIPQPDHPFFTLPRWRMIGHCSSYYHIPWASSTFKESYIFSRSDLKDYDNEIDSFFDWIRPYLDEADETCIGWKWYEEDFSPTLIYKKGV